LTRKKIKNKKNKLKVQGKYTYQYQIHLFDPADRLWQTSLYERSTMVILKLHHKKIF